MKRAAFFAVLVTLALAITGCIVQSLHPFYADASKVLNLHLEGRWKLVTNCGDQVADETAQFWDITTNRFVTCDKNGTTGCLAVVFFKVDNQLFCDSLATDEECNDNQKINTYWQWHVRRVHTLSKVETNATELKLRPLNYSWLDSNIQTGQVTLAHLQENDFLLFTATSADWEQFLLRYGADTNAFSDKCVFVLKRDAKK